MQLLRRVWARYISYVLYQSVWPYTTAFTNDVSITVKSKRGKPLLVGYMSGV